MLALRVGEGVVEAEEERLIAVSRLASTASCQRP
jgi:hypothetical protein